MHKTTTILGVNIDILNQAQLLNIIKDSLQKGVTQIVTVNGEIILKARKDKKYQEIINNAELKICDSTNLHWVSFLTKNPIVQKIPGSSLAVDICQIAQENNKSVFLLGSKPGVAEKAATQLKTLFPDLIIAGYSSADPSDTTVISQIKKANSDIVMVAYGAPNQEFWIAKNRIKAGAKLYIGVGGTLDMLAGNTPRAPLFMRTLSLEWLWRLILQPTRFNRIINAVFVFPFLAVIDIAFRKK